MNDVVQFPIPELVSSDPEQPAPLDLPSAVCPTSAPATVGEQLAASRQQKTWTIAFVADQLKLSQTQILALEANQFDALPQLVIVRGFVRAYAKLLKIDADALVALLPRESEMVKLATSLRPALSTPFVDSRMSLSGHHDNNKRYIYGAVFLLLLVISFLIAQYFGLTQSMTRYFAGSPAVVAETTVADDELKNELNGEATAQTLPVSESQPTSITPTAPHAEQGAPVSASDLHAAVVVPSVEKELSKLPVPTPAPLALVEVRPSVATNPSAQMNGTPDVARVPPLGELFMLKFRQDSWIQVKSESGVVLSSHIARAGTQESFSVKQALQVKIGNAAGVDATLRGAALVITPENGSNVANLSVK
ncbi:MAG: DUF4115 domain-containing protein [Undibacterium sp.]|nr:DUF4115 domain-containing protein [Undibacterium sp.]